MKVRAVYRHGGRHYTLGGETLGGEGFSVRLRFVELDNAQTVEGPIGTSIVEGDLVRCWEDVLPPVLAEYASWLKAPKEGRYRREVSQSMNRLFQNNRIMLKHLTQLIDDQNYDFAKMIVMTADWLSSAEVALCFRTGHYVVGETEEGLFQIGDTNNISFSLPFVGSLSMPWTRARRFWGWVEPGGRHKRYVHEPELTTPDGQVIRFETGQPVYVTP